MALKPIIDIDINDQKWQRFQQHFSKYQDALLKMPAKWKAVNAEQAKNASGFEQIAAAMMAHHKVLEETERAEKDRAGNLQRTEHLWTSMAKSSTTFAKNVLSAGASLLKWGGLIFGGMVGGSLWGIDRLASNAAGTRRQSMGLGLSTGELQAFRTNFSRVVDPDSFLNTVNDILTDPRKSWAAAALGVGTSGSTAHTAVDLLKAMRSRARSTDVSMLGLLGQQTGIDVGTDVWRRLHDMSSSEFNSLLQANRRDVGALGYSDRTGRSFTDFENQLERAKKQIEAVFITGLVPLTPALSRLSTSVAGFLGTLMRSPLVKGGLEKLGHGIDWLAAKVNSPQFEKDVEDVLASLGEIGKGLIQFGMDLKEILPSIHSTLQFIAHPLAKTDEGVLGGIVSGAASRSQFLKNPTVSGYEARFATLEQAYGLPKGMLAYQFQQESSSQLYPKDSAKGGAGPFQLTPIAMKQVEKLSGLHLDPRDPLQAALAASIYDKYLLGQFKGDLRTALAAYNWGETNVSGAIKRNGPNWLGHTPAETQNYVMRPTPGGNVRIQIDNATGGSAIVSSAQLGAAR